TSRNLVGSISVSLANTELVQRWQFHQSRLAENLTQSSLSFQSAVHNLTQYFGQFGSPAGAPSRAFGYIGHLIADQAAVMDYTKLRSWIILTYSTVGRSLPRCWCPSFCC